MDRIPPTLDMTPDGGFRTPPRPGAGLPVSVKLLAGAVVVALVAGAFSVAALAVWIISMMLPVLVIAGAVAWGTWKYRRWQLLRGTGHVRRP